MIVGLHGIAELSKALNKAKNRLNATWNTTQCKAASFFLLVSVFCSQIFRILSVTRISAVRALFRIRARVAPRVLHFSAFIFFHDESTFTANEAQPTQWGIKGEKMMKKKSKGAGIMVSDFIDEHNGFLAL